MQRLYHQTVVYAWTVHQSYCMRVPPNPSRCRAISHHRINVCTSVGIATVETLHATSLPPNRRVCMDGASIVLHARPAKPRAVLCHLPPPDFYLCVCWHRTRRDVACNVSTPPGRRVCINGTSIVLHARPTKHRAASCHFPPSDRYSYVCWYRNRRDVACNVSTTKPSYMHGRFINRIACASHQTHRGVVPFPTIGSMFVRRLVSQP
jgi:hypothetical protein